MSSLTISTFQPQISWPYGGSTATLRIKYSASFTDSTGQQVLRGLYKDVPCTVAAGVLTVPPFTLITTNDAQVNPLVTCSAQFIDSNQSPRDWLFQQAVIPQSLTPTTNIAALQIFNLGASLVSAPDFYLTRDQTTQLVLALLVSIGVLADASAATKGITMLSIDPTILTQPKAWGQNDPAARDAQKLKGVTLDALMASPANTDVPVFDAISGTWKPGVGTQGAAGGDLSGTYPSPSVVNDSHFHSAATITSLPAHAVDHEAGGSDEISALGLSGLLADAQTPLAHKTSHENGGADEISVLGLSGLLADAQTPTAHAASHISGGSDPFTSAQLLEAIIKRIQTSTGPTTLTVGAVADGEFLKRVGATIVSAVPTGTGYSVAEDEGTPVTARSTMNFEGAGVSVADAGGKTVVTIPGGGGSTSFAGIDKFSNL